MSDIKKVARPEDRVYKLDGWDGKTLLTMIVPGAQEVLFAIMDQDGKQEGGIIINDGEAFSRLLWEVEFDIIHRREAKNGQ